MDIYLVGGAVRDRLLGRPVRERDFVVVGASEQEMLDAGYRPVGRDFPVFLHPQTNEEYALARTERKSGPGHQGFICHADPGVTLEEDLMRRDLTINAMAQDKTGNIVDPYGGQQDLDNRFLRHVSDAFTEDPLRILRIARFKATFPDFSVHPDTWGLLKYMVAEGALAELTPERVLMELDKALVATAPEEFFGVLAEINANEALWPELDQRAFERLAQLASQDPEARFAILFDNTSEATVHNFCRRYRISNQRREVTSLYITHGQTWARLKSLTAEAIVDLLYASDAFRKRERFIEFDRVCSEITGRSLRWPLMLKQAERVSAASIDRELSGPELGKAIRAQRVKAVAGNLP